MKIWQYPACGTCKKALSWVKSRGIEAETADITATPPPAALIAAAAALIAAAAAQLGSVKPLFNTSGVLYREMNIKDRLAAMSQSEAVELLASHGKLIKRPFAQLGDGSFLVGFKEAEWEASAP